MAARPRFLLSGWSLGLIATLISCAALDPLPGGTCGNGVIDPKEDCDTHDIGSFTCGAPGTPAACRITCTAAAQCPDGWGCGVDGVCRQPSGVFPSAGEPLSSGIAGLTVGDFDGDGRKDILGTGVRSADNTARAHVLYFGAGAALEHSVFISAPIASPTVRNFDRDPDNTDDFAFGIGEGFGLVTGRKDRSLVPVLFPSFRAANAEATPIVIRGVRALLPDSTLDTSIDPGLSWDFLFAGRIASTTAWVLATTGQGSKPGYLHVLPPVTEVTGGPVWAPLFPKDLTSTCGEVVLAYNTVVMGQAQGQLAVHSPCRPGVRSVWANDRAPLVLTAAKVGGLHVTDVNGDGNLDVILATDAGLEVAYGDGKTLAAPTALDTSALPLVEVPLASGDLNGDGVTDYVTPSSIVLSTSVGAVGPARTTYAHLTSPRRTRWSAARFGNVTPAGASPDAGASAADGGGSAPAGTSGKVAFVVAASADQPDIDFYSGATADLLPATSTIPTNGSVTLLEVGDFDGDTQDDVAFVETNTTTNAQDLSYAYGKGYGPPEAPALVGGVSAAAALVLQPVDSVTQPLWIFNYETVATDPLRTLAAAIVVSSGDRQPVAPLILPDAKGQALAPLPPGQGVRKWSPLAVVSGPMQDPARVDLSGLAIGYTFDLAGQPKLPPYPAGFWAATGTGDAKFDVPVEVQDFGSGPTANLELLDAHTATFTPTIRAADIDVPPDGVDEILALARVQKTYEPQLFVVHVPTPARAAAGALPDVKQISLAADGVGLGGVVLRAADIDGDGALDLVVMLGTTGPAITQGSKLVVYLNQKGTFAPPGLTIPIPPGADFGPVSMTPIIVGGASPTAGGGRGRAIAVVTQHRLLLATLHADKKGFDVVDATPPLFGAAGMGAATGISAGDFDGDGVDDLAIADNGSVRILLQESTQTARSR
jgi:hypothetical protein